MGCSLDVWHADVGSATRTLVPHMIIDSMSGEHLPKVA